MTKKWSKEKAFDWLTTDVEDLAAKPYLAPAIASHMMRLVPERTLRETVDVFVLNQFEKLIKGGNS